MTDWQPSSFHKKSYGRMGSISADPNLCAEEVASKDGWAYSQCSRKRGHGSEQAYCKQHDPDAVKAKREANAPKWREEYDAKTRRGKPNAPQPSLARTLSPRCKRLQTAITTRADWRKA
jgi:hypothetical protein